VRTVTRQITTAAMSVRQSWVSWLVTFTYHNFYMFFAYLSCLLVVSTTDVLTYILMSVQQTTM